MLTNSEPAMKHTVQADLILTQSVYSHSREGQQAAGDLGSQVMHCSLCQQKQRKPIIILAYLT